MTFSWLDVAARLKVNSANFDHNQLLDSGQQASLSWIAERIGRHGVVLADEVGTGKTRIACALVHAVVEAGGRAAVVVPRGLMHQWESESKKLKATAPTPKSFTTLTEFLRNAPVTTNAIGFERAEQSWTQKAPNAHAPEWCLISHGFRSPTVRSNSYAWRLALPSLVQMHRAPETEQLDRRTQAGRLLGWLDDYAPRWWEWQGMRRIAKQVAPQAGSLSEEIRCARAAWMMASRADRLMAFTVAGSVRVA